MKLKLIFIILLSAVSSWTFALGLGNIELNSGLNQPFDARIELLSPTADDLNTINISLASIDDFRRAGIDRPFILSQLRFTIEEGETGPDYIRITSKEAIREPFLNFLLEANWSNGRLYRKYTVLLDPPLYGPNVRRSLSPVVPNGPTSTPVAPSVSSTEQPSVEEQDTGTSLPSSVFSGDSYGPISANETLWSIASRVRPDNSITIQQMMLALLRANPDAFIDNNINGLKRGQILRIPDQDEITSQSSEEALATVRSQNALWEEFSGFISSDPAVRPLSGTDTTSVETEVITSESEPELRLVSPSELGEGGGLTTGTDTDTSLNSEDLALANEQLETLSSENVDLRERFNESEAIIQDLRRLIELKDDELATLQQQLTGGRIVTEGIDDLDIEEDVEEDEVEEFGPEEFESEEIDAVEFIEEETFDEEMVEAEDLVDEITEQIEEEVEEIAVTQSVVTTVQSPSQPGLIEQILDWVKGNLMIVGGAIVAIVLIAVAVVFIRKKKTASGDEEVSVALPTEFPDFSSTAEEAPAPESEIEEEEPDFDLSAEPEDEVGDDATVLLSESESADLAPTAEESKPEAAEPEEDPLAEVNVFLAYEHFDQAEEFVRDAIVGDPDNLDFHGKLLEVFYSAADKAKYEEEAQVLHDLVNGEGPQWEMATIMWQGMSPNRALFAEAVEEEQEAGAEEDKTGGGIVDLTADEDSGEDAGLDFDIGGATDEPAASTDEDVLDVTSGSEEEDLLDVTVAVGLDAVEDEVKAGADEEENLLDITGGTEPEESEDILDISSAGGEDLLDVTAHTDLDINEDEDLLDVTVATSLEASTEDVPPEPEQTDGDDNALDFDIGGVGTTETENTDDVASSSDNVVDFDSSAASAESDDGLDLDMGIDIESPAESQEVDLDSGEEDGGIELDLGSDEVASKSDDGLELDLGLDTDEDDGGIELDLGTDEDTGDEGLDLSLDSDDVATDDVADESIELDLSMEDESEGGDLEIDMDSTMEMPKDSKLSLDQDDDDDDDEDDDEDHTVFVPRTSDATEQSQEDEIATKLDLAKAYVELGDKDSAKPILDEVVNDGNDKQRKQAEELLSQIS